VLTHSTAPLDFLAIEELKHRLGCEASARPCGLIVAAAVGSAILPLNSWIDGFAGLADVGR